MVYEILKLLASIQPIFEEIDAIMVELLFFVLFLILTTTGGVLLQGVIETTDHH